MPRQVGVQVGIQVGVGVGVRYGVGVLAEHSTAWPVPLYEPV